jgi:hypothetical protein
MRYLNKIIFINSARIQYAEIQIDGNVHFIGTQGVGKSTALRALLFFYNADKTKLGISKEKKSFDEYYFPYVNSYIIYEVVVDDASYCVLAFRSQGRVCFRFLGTGYKKEYFISPEGKAYEEWDQIRDALGSFVYKSRRIETYEEAEKSSPPTISGRTSFFFRANDCPCTFIRMPRMSTANP